MGKNARVKPFILFLLLLLSTTSLYSVVNEVKNIEIVKGELRLKFTKNCDKRKIKSFTLTHPYRKVFDFKDTRLLHTKMFHNLENCKVAQYKPNTVRVVIKNPEPYSCTPYKPMLAEKNYHIPLPKGMNALPATRYKRPKIDIKITDKKTKSSIKKVKKVKMIAEERSYTKSSRKYYSHKNELIVIDAGHGGHDTGAIGGGKREKDLVLSIAKKVAKELKKRGYPVYLTRNSNRFLKLSQRTHIADKKGSVAFISIHANSVPKKYRNRAHGVETFFLQNTRDARSQRIAARENAAVLKGAGSRLSKKVIIDSVLNGPKIVQSNKLAIDVQRRIITNLRSKYRGIRDGGVRHAPFYVLVGASRPSILVEVGYISHATERKRLFTSRYQDLIAKGIAEGVSNYLHNRRKEIEL